MIVVSFEVSSSFQLTTLSLPKLQNRIDLVSEPS